MLDVYRVHCIWIPSPPEGLGEVSCEHSFEQIVLLSRERTWVAVAPMALDVIDRLGFTARSERPREQRVPVGRSQPCRKEHFGEPILEATPRHSLFFRTHVLPPARRVAGPSG